MTDQDVITSMDGGVLEIQLNRPTKKNALTTAMYSSIIEALEKADTDRAVRVVLITAVGDYFTAGNDLGDFLAVTSGKMDRGEMKGGQFLIGLVDLQKPVIALVQGHAVGIGVTMLPHCDLVFVNRDAKLTTPFTNLGLVPEAGSSLTIPSSIGHAKAYAVLALGEPITGQEAAILGLANTAGSVPEINSRAREAARSLAKKPPESLRLTKDLMRNRPAIHAQMRREHDGFAERLKSAEVNEAFAAFMERREPDFDKLTRS